MQPVDTGGPIVRRHDASEYSLCLADSAWAWVWDLDILESEFAVTLFVEAGLRRKAGVLLVSAVRRSVALEADSEGVFLVGELVDEVAGITPKREVVGVRGRCVEGGPRAILIVVEQISRVAVTGA